MAKKKAKLSITAPTSVSTAADAQREDEYKLRDDADKIRRYAELRKDKGRHDKAMKHIQGEHDQIRAIAGDYEADEGTEQPRVVARAGRKRSVRRIGRA